MRRRRTFWLVGLALAGCDEPLPAASRFASERDAQDTAEVADAPIVDVGADAPDDTPRSVHGSADQQGSDALIDVPNLGLDLPGASGKDK